MNTQLWNRPATIERNNFKYKSLSCWSYNIAVGCEHACRFCYVPYVSTIRMGAKLATMGVKDPDAEWGGYVFLRKWDREQFLRSLFNATRTPAGELNADGHRAVMLCTTTDPYQVGGTTSPSPGGEGRGEGGQLSPQEFQAQRRFLVREALGCLLNTDLNVRILTRSPLAREDFDLMRQFGNRLLFGMSLPTLNNKLAKIYEPKAPAPSQRLETLKAAKTAGLNVFVAVAPVYPDCGAADMEATLRAVKELDPVTIFMEPINIRAENVQRIADEGKKHGVELRTGVFETPELWRRYAVNQMRAFEICAAHLGVADRLHLWPDASLGSKDARQQFAHTAEHLEILGVSYETWLQSHWNKISAWPK